MAKEYNPKEIEKKWQDKWDQTGQNNAKTDGEKYYVLIEFPYPSGDGLHVGHVRSYTALDVLSRMRRMEGKNVLYPIGWDAFGLPTENYAIKTGKDPKVVTKENTDNFRKQIKSLGISFDWSREINTTDPKYYKWTQWLFLKFLEHGLAYKAKMPINWCPKDKIGLANEEVVDGKCERCGTEVEMRDKEQWMLQITDYAEKLLSDLDTVDYPERVKASQRNWIGRSEGALIKFDDIEIYTTRPDTIYGATFLVRSGKEDKFTGEYVTNPATKEKIPVWEAEYVLADYGTGAIMGVPAHDERDYEFAKKHNLPIKQVAAPIFVDKTNPIKDGAENTERSGVIILVKHWSEEKYLLNYSPKFNWKCLFTGGIESDEDPIQSAVRELAEETGYVDIESTHYIPLEHVDKFYAPHKGVNRVVTQKNIFIKLASGKQEEVKEEEKSLHHLSWLTEEEMRREITLPNHLFVFETELSGGRVIESEGVLINSEKFNGLESVEAKQKITEHVGGKWVTKYKLRDWVFSRQRYWGEPIPVVHCAQCGVVPVPESDLPVTLPEVENYLPTDNGESPLAKIDEWVNTKCPKCGVDAKRETDTMPNWAGSSWYFLRYMDPHNDDKFASEKALKYFAPVDWYNGGMEHTTLHLLYSRFWNKFFFDIGLVPTSEPYKKRTSHGIILASDGEKMSKSRGNVINPDKVIEQFGADTLRIYEMFMGPFEQMIQWNDDALVGPRRFLERVWKLKDSKWSNHSADNNFEMNSVIKKVTNDIENMSFNTAVSSLMIYTNTLEKRSEVAREEYEALLKLLAPFAPHMAEELWAELGNTDSIHTTSWPKWDEKALVKSEVTYAVQVNGKVRGEIVVSSQMIQAEIEQLAQKNEGVAKWIEGKSIKKVIVVPLKIVNIVVA